MEAPGPVGVVASAGCLEGYSAAVSVLLGGLVDGYIGGCGEVGGFECGVCGCSDGLEQEAGDSCLVAEVFERGEGGSGVPADGARMGGGEGVDYYQACSGLGDPLCDVSKAFGCVDRRAVVGNEEGEVFDSVAERAQGSLVVVGVFAGEPEDSALSSGHAGEGFAFGDCDCEGGGEVGLAGVLLAEEGGAVAEAEDVADQVPWAVVSFGGVVESHIYTALSRAKVKQPF